MEGMMSTGRERRSSSFNVGARGRGAEEALLALPSRLSNGSNSSNGSSLPNGSIGNSTSNGNDSVSAVALQASTPAEGDSLRDEQDDLLISALVDSDEIPALVRSAFEIESSSAETDGSNRNDNTNPASTSGGGTTTSAQTLLASLRRIVALKEREVAEITKVHYEDFVRSVDELRMVKRYSSELRKQVQSFNSTISSSGEDLLKTIEDAASLLR